MLINDKEKIKIIEQNSIAICYRSNVGVPLPKIHMLKLNLQCDGIQKWEVLKT